MADENEGKTQVYYIPPNYEDAGGMLGGHITQRNGIELIVLCGPIAFLELKFLNFSWQTNIIIALLTLVPLATITIFGIGGESLSQRLFAIIRFRRNRKRLSYRSFVTESSISNGNPWSLNSIMDNVASNGFKGAFMQAKDSRKKATKAQAAEEPEDEWEEEEDDEFDAPEPIAKPKRTAPRRAAPHHQAATAPARRRKTSGTFVNSALKEKLLEKLELGEEDEDDESYY